MSRLGSRLQQMRRSAADAAPDARAVRGALREGSGPSLRRRRRIAALSALGMVDFALISLYQVGVIRRLPDLPGPLFDSNHVNASRQAYATGLPDGTTGALLFAGTLVLAAAGGSRSAGRAPVWDLLLGGATLAGSVAAVRYLWDMVRSQQRACPYCLVGAGASFASLALAAPEVRGAWRDRARRGLAEIREAPRPARS